MTYDFNWTWIWINKKDTTRGSQLLKEAQNLWTQNCEKKNLNNDITTSKF